jgi:hypothetical protein
MDTEIRYRESSARPCESTGAFLTADDVNELCRRWIEAERERTRALLTELLIQICDKLFPRSFRSCPNCEGRPDLPVSCRSSRSGRARRSSMKARSLYMTVVAIRHCATPANRRTTRRIGSVSRLLAATLSRSVIAARSREM